MKPSYQADMTYNYQKKAKKFQEYDANVLLNNAGFTWIYIFYTDLPHLRSFYDQQCGRPNVSDETHLNHGLWVKEHCYLSEHPNSHEVELLYFIWPRSKEESQARPLLLIEYLECAMEHLRPRVAAICESNWSGVGIAAATIKNYDKHQ